MEQNYGSTGTILKAANVLIANNPDRLGKDLWTSGADGDPVRVYAGLTRWTKPALSPSVSAKRWPKALPTATSPFSTAPTPSPACWKRPCSCRSALPHYGGQRFFERAEIKNALAYLRLASNQDDDAS